MGKRLARVYSKSSRPALPSEVVIPATPSALAVATSNGRLRVTRVWELFDKIALEILSGQLQGVVTISLPPQHGKTTWANAFSAWMLAHKPDTRTIMASYSHTYASKLGRKVRDLVERNQKLLGIRVRSDVASASEWEIQGREGGVLSSGYEGGIAGRSCDLAIVDDPIKDAEAASSAAEKQKIWDWWVDDLSTRMQKGGTRILIMTRRATDDPVGRLMELAAAGHENVTSIVLPAIAEEDEDWERWGWRRKEGEALVPELHSAEMLRRYEKSGGPFRWAGQYMQRPYPRGGGSFKSEWIPIAPAPQAGSMVRSWDLAISEKKSACRTAGALLSRCYDRGASRFHLHNIVYGRWGPGERDQHIIETARTDGKGVPILIEKEGGSGGTAQVYHLRQQLPGWIVKEASPKGSKEARADALASAAQGGLVTMTEAHWNREFREEIDSFPSGPTCDLVDACAHGFNHLAEQADEVVRVWAVSSMPRNQVFQRQPGQARGIFQDVPRIFGGIN